MNQSGCNGRYRDDGPRQIGWYPKVAGLHVKSDGIPKLRGYLPLVKQTRMLSFQQLLRSQIRFEEVFFHLLGVIHIDHTLGLLLGGSCLAAPLGAFNEESAILGLYVSISCVFGCKDTKNRRLWKNFSGNYWK